VNEARILIVDDDLALLEALPQALKLRMNGITIDTSESAADALEAIRETDYDAIVTDIKMPGMDGLALLGAIQEVRPGTPTLLITGHGEHDLAVQALRGGAYDFVAKPIDRDYFIASLERAIQTRRLDQQVDKQRLALERHALVLEHVDDGVFLVDEDGLIQHWNPAAQSITGIASEDILGRPADDALPGWQAMGPTVPVASVPGPGSTEAKTFPLEIDGRELWLSISGVEFTGGIVYAFRNLTEERALEELKGEFVATVSHELRTPLAAIYGSAQTLLRRDVELDDSNKQKLLAVIASESERLTRIASDILLANNLDSGRLFLDRQQVEVVQLARDVVEEMRSLFADREEISFELVVPNSPEVLQGDGDKLRQVLINLLDNAVKYSPDGGRIELRVETHEDALRLLVSDEGLGIPSGDQGRIFGKFYRVDPQQSRGVGGTGLGLYISRELVRNMEGRLSVTSREGEGSTFVVELPRALARTPARAPEVARQA
jgi:PAS domain S-box-containing protein